MWVLNELFVFACWLDSSVCLSLLLSALPLGHLPFSCLLPWLLLRSRDKAHWCLSAPWQITEADRYKDSGRQLQYTGGQRRTCLGFLSWPQHQSSLNAIWLLVECCCCSVNYCFKRDVWENVGNIWNVLWIRRFKWNCKMTENGSIFFFDYYSSDWNVIRKLELQ